MGAKLVLPGFASVLVALLFSKPAPAQTFVQVADLDPPNTVGPRLTSTVVRNKLQKELFSELTAKITLINATANPPVVYEFTSDAVWNRILFGQKDVYINQFTNAGSGRRPVEVPGGLDVSASRLLYIADRSNELVLIARFDPVNRSLTQVATIPQTNLGGVTDVAWDGQTVPLTTEYFYALSGGGKLSYWSVIGSTAFALWTYGTAGSSQDQFKWPSGVCVGHAVGANGGSVFTTDVYVADAGNKRLVWLRRSSQGATWMGSVQLPDNGVPTDCTADHFGNVIAVDPINHRLVKYTWNLEFLDKYGAYGVGATNHNTFASPHAVHVPFGTKVNGSGQTVFYGEGRVLTAEQWSANTGAREHYFGLDLDRTAGPTTSEDLVTLSYRVTDHNHQRVWVRSANNVVVRQLRDYPALMPPGTHTIIWDGRKNDGSPAAPGYYYFNVFAYSDYGCTWCNKSIVSSSFWFAGLPCNPPAAALNAASLPQQANPPAQAQQPCNSPADPMVVTGPTKAFLHQRVFGEPRILTRVAAAEASAPSVESPADGGRLSDLVRAYGVTGLSFGVPDNAAGTTVTIRVYTSAGRLARILVNQPMQPGFYEIGWDGLDDRGRAVAAGVYFAVLTMGAQRVTQRLLIRH